MPTQQEIYANIVINTLGKSWITARSAVVQEWDNARSEVIQEWDNAHPEVIEEDKAASKETTDQRTREREREKDLLMTTIQLIKT